MQRDRWVDYPRAIEARLRLERLLGTPERERMPCMVLHGESNIGKTLIVRKFQHDHPTVFDAVRGVERRRIVAMQIPATPDQKRFYSALLFVSWRMVKKPQMRWTDEGAHLLAQVRVHAINGTCISGNLPFPCDHQSPFTVPRKTGIRCKAAYPPTLAHSPTIRLLSNTFNNIH